MSDESKSVVSDVNTPATTTVAAPVTPVVSTPLGGDDKENQKWVKERLERERNKIFEDLGASSEEIKAAIEHSRAQVEAKKTAEQKSVELDSDLKKARKENEKLQGSLKSYADAQLAGLSPERREVVMNIAGDSPSAQLKTLNALLPTWATGTQALAATPVVVAPTVIPDSAPPRNAPTPNGATIEENPAQTYARYKDSNPFVAARFASQHDSIYDTKKK